MPKRSVLVAAAAAAVAIAAVTVAPGGASAATTKPVTVVADTQAMYYGGSEPSLTYTVYGLANGDRLTRNPTCTAPAHRAAGKYSITCANARVDPAKYTLKYVAGPLYVGRAPLYVGPNYQQIRYGDKTPSFTYATFGLVGDDKLVTAPTCDVAGAHTNAGRYTISCTGADAGPNYDLKYRDNYFDVAKVTLLTGPDAQAIYFGSPEPAFTSSTFGLVNGEKLITEPTCAVAGEHVHVGKYTIACTGAKATDNYTLNVATNTYTIAQNTTVLLGEKAAIKRNLLGQPTSATLRTQLYLVYPYGTVFTGQSVTVTAGSTTLCTATTDKSGYAGCTLNSTAANALAKNGSYTATYAGQAQDIAASSVTVKNS